MEGGEKGKRMKYTGNCECCKSPLGQEATLKGVKRSVCSECLGFIYRWILDIEATATASLPAPPALPSPHQVEIN